MSRPYELLTSIISNQETNNIYPSLISLPEDIYGNDIVVKERNRRVSTGLDVKAYGPQINNKSTAQRPKSTSIQHPKLQAYGYEQHPKLRAYGYEDNSNIISSGLIDTKNNKYKNK